MRNPKEVAGKDSKDQKVRKSKVIPRIETSGTRERDNKAYHRIMGCYCMAKSKRSPNDQRSDSKNKDSAGNKASQENKAAAAEKNKGKKK
jgi:hypothetical protein